MARTNEQVANDFMRGHDAYVAAGNYRLYADCRVEHWVICDRDGAKWGSTVISGKRKFDWQDMPWTAAKYPTEAAALAVMRGLKGTGPLEVRPVMHFTRVPVPC